VVAVVMLRTCHYDNRMATGSIVITGASTGIGEACALRLDALGYRVFAGVRKPADGEALKKKASGQLSPLLLDVTSEESLAAAVRTVGDIPLAGLVNNAGIVVAGPLELVPIAMWRKQLEVNVIGQVAVTQAFLPMLRAGRGRIVNMGSVAGRSALPFSGPYCASKFALEGLTDSLRMELRQWGISVSIIEPGAIRTPIWDKSAAGANEYLNAVPAQLLELYRAMLAKLQAAAAHAGKHAIGPEEVAKAVEHALTSTKPKTRYVVGSDAKLRMRLIHLPDRLVDSLILKKLNSVRAE
jgi:NAD(P)-dependent dehydrogenase (short-subunit alcohol dehydrogenase family)